MVAYADHQSAEYSKVLVVGDSGSGKTSLLAGLANAGFKLHIADFDNGLDILKEYLEPGAIENVDFEPLSADTDEFAISKMNKMVRGKWSEELGSIRSWNSDHVLVIDSLTFMSDAAKRIALKKGGKTPEDNLSQADWGTAQRLVSGILSLVMSSAVTCNVVVNAHIQFIDEDGSVVSRAYPASCGKGLSTVVGRYFNNVFRLDTKMVRGKAERRLRTVSDQRMSLKNTAPALISEEEEADLAKIFALLRTNAEGKKKIVKAS